MTLKLNPITGLPDETGGDKGETGNPGDQGPKGDPGTVTGAVFFLDSSVDPTIANYLQLTPQGPAYIPGTEQTLTASVSPGQTVYLGVGGIPKSFISQTPINDTFIQQGDTLFDNFASVNNNNGNVTLTAEVYARTTGGVESGTPLFSATTAQLSGSSAVAWDSHTDNAMAAVNVSDRYVVKYKATKTGGSGATIVTLYFQGSAHASHVHSTLGIPPTGVQIIPVDVAVPTGGSPVTTEVYVTPATPVGPGRWILSKGLLRVKEALTGTAPTCVARIGSSSGGQEILKDVALSNLNSVGDVFGVAVAERGAGMPITNNYSALYDASQGIYLTLTPGGTVTGGLVRVYLYLEALS